MLPNGFPPKVHEHVKEWMSAIRILSNKSLNHASRRRKL